MVVADNNARDIYNWVCKSLKMTLSNTVTMGVVDDKGSLLAGIVYFVDDFRICHISVYAKSPLWLMPGRLNEILKIGFDMLDCKILKFEVSHKNARAIKLLKGLHLVQEGLLRFARKDGTHEIVFSLTKKEMFKKRWYRK